MKNRIALALSMAFSASTFANVGVGVSVRDDDTRIYVPINVTESFRIEPFVNYGKREEKDDDWEESVKAYEFGLGFFGRTELVDKLHFLYGARISYLSAKAVNKDSDGSSYKYDVDGYSIAPTMGFEYFIMEKLSIGADVSLVYAKTDSESKSYDYDYDYGAKVEQTNKDTETDTSLNVKFYF